jgi:Uma2 family endonuclease
MGMSVGTLIPVEEYLSTSYEPDAEYVDGAVVERHVGGWMQGLIQSNINFALRRKYRWLKVLGPERLRINEARYYIPDVIALLKLPKIPFYYVEEPPFLVVEILSPEDRMARVMEKFQDYQMKGVQNIWLIHPEQQRVFVYQAGDLIEMKGDAVATGEPRVELTRDEIFQA